jgi:ABC-type dipeptide/oligopeptide/nickel transport system permease component
MLRFIIRRVVVIIPMVFIVISLTWVLVRLAPGSFYSGEKKLAAGIENNLREKYGLNQPWYVQYGKVLRNITRLDFGNSLKYEGQSVNQILWRALPVSAALGLSAYILALIVGIFTGTLSALKPNSWIDYSSMTLAMLGISIPNFVLGPLLVLLFSLTLFLVSARAVGRISEPQPGAAGADVVGDLHSLHCAADQIGDVGNHAVRLHPHGAGERFDRRPGGDPSRAAGRFVAGDFFLGTGVGVPDHRHRSGRESFRAAGTGKLFY